MVSISTADAALKSYYLDAVAAQLNTGINPLLAKIECTTADVWGKNIIKSVTYGLNGGVGAGAETGNLPVASGNSYAKMTSTLKNLYGTIEISDKVILASANNSGAFINVLNAEMEGLLRASKFNFGRMLYGDGTGVITTTVAFSGNTDKHLFKVSSTKKLMEGMLIDIYPSSGSTPALTARKILEIDRINNVVKFDGVTLDSVIGADYRITMQGSYGVEITGLGSIFKTTGNIYGLSRDNNAWLVPYIHTDNGAISTGTIQTAIDYIDEISGGSVNYISTAYDVRRFYLDYLALSRTNIDYMNLDGGFKAISYNGIPVVADRFVDDGKMYLLNTDNFKIHQLCDWRWIEGENGRVLTQRSGSATYTATLVKYAELICDRPIGQAMITGITAASA